MIAVQKYICPEQLDDALQQMSSGDYTPLAGGTDLIIQMRDSKSRKLLDLGKLGLDYIRDDGDKIEIGSTATHAVLASDKLIAETLPALGKASSLVGSQQVRNRGTIGGNIVNASPCADTVPALLLYDAELLLLSAKGKRIVSLAKFILESYRTSLRPDEILHSIICQRANGHAGWSYTKLGRRQAVNISRMTLAVSLELDGDNKIIEAQISAGSVFPISSRMPIVEKFLMGQMPSRELFDEASKAAAELMIEEGGFRWSTPYKKPALIGLLSRTLEEALIRHSSGAKS